MTIFGASKLGRAAYAILMLLMFGFDFAKDPIANFIMAQHDEAARQLMAPRPQNTEQPTAQQQKSTGKNMPLMLPGQEEMIKEIAASGRKPTPEDMEKLRAATLSGAMQLATGAGTSRSSETAALAARRSTFETLYMLAMIAMTAITVVGLLYMVSSRIRDIGWPQYVMWVPVAPVFIPKFISIPLPPFAIQGIGVFFYAVLLMLALVPGSGSRPSDRYPIGARPLTTIKRKPGQFGKLGTE